MKNRNKLFTSIAILGSAIFAMVLTAGTGVFEALGLFNSSRATNNGTYAINFTNKKNAYLGEGTQVVLTENGGAVNFSFSNCAKLTGGFATINNGGTISNNEQITSINKVNAVYTASTGASLKFKASLDKIHWGEYVTIASDADFILDSHPYYLQFAADGGSINIESLNISFLCSPNPNAEKEGGDSIFRLKKDFDCDEDISGTYLIVGNARNNTNVCLDGSLSSGFADNNSGYPVTINSDSTITYSEELNDRTFTISKYDVGSDGYYMYDVKAASGVYIGTDSAKSIKTSTTAHYFDNEFWYGSDESRDNGETTFLKFYSGGYYLRYNYDNNTPPTNKFNFYNNFNMQDVYLYQLFGEGGGGDPTPVYESGILHTANKTTFSVNEKLNDFLDSDEGVKISVRMSDGSTTSITKDKYNVKIEDSLGNEVLPTSEFPHAGLYYVTISYKALLPITFTINANDFATSITAFKTTTSYDVGDAINLSDVTAKVNYYIEETDQFITYSNFAANNLTATLKNPSGQTVSTSGTFNVSGRWHLVISLIDNPSISTTVDIDVAVVSVTSITLDKTSATIEIGSQETITPTVLPENASDKGVTWTSSASSVASVSGGVVTALAEGTATITAKAGNYTATCNVTVIPVYVDGISVASLGNMNIGDERDLNVTISPANATNKTVSYSTNPAGIVSITADGKVTAIAAGSTVITVTTEDGSYFATTSVTVSAVNVSSVTLDKTELDLTIDDSAVTLNATVLPANATNKGIIWSSDDNTVATVSGDGSAASVTPVAVGTATITATSASDSTKYAECEVTVSKIKSWTLVTNTSQLINGNKYVFVSYEAGKDSNYYALSSNQFEKNRRGTLVNKNENTITSVSNAEYPIAEFTLGTGSQNGTYSFYDSVSYSESTKTNVGYLFASSSSSNNLNTESTISVNSSWTVSIDSDGEASIIAESSTNRNVMQFNYNNGSPLFACYASASQTSVCLYTNSEGGDVPPEKELISISISGQTTAFTQGDTFSFGGTVTAHYDDGTTADVTSIASFSGYSMSAVGTQTVTVSYMGQTQEYEITVSSLVVTLQSISVSGQKVAFNVGDTFSFGGTVTGLFSDSTRQDVTSSATFNGYNMSQAGKQTVTVTVGTVTTTYQITVNASSPVDVAEDMTIEKALFGTSISYNDCAGTYNISENGNYEVSINRVCVQSTQLQFSAPKNTAGKIYNLTSLPLATITISPASACSDLKVYSGNEQNPTQDEVLGSNGVYVFGGEAYFSITSLATVKVDSIVISVGTPEPVNPTGITIGKSSTNISIGQTEKLTYSLLPTNCNQNKGVAWSTDNSSVCTVDQNGNIKGISEGTAHITVKSTFNNNFAASCTVYVSRVSVTSITVAPSSKTLVLNDTVQLSATVLPSNASNSAVTWSTNNNNATVTASGLVTAKAVGTTTITATAKDGSGVRGTCVITIVDHQVVEEDAWTILVYMCGADLESGWDSYEGKYDPDHDVYYASEDLDEIKKVKNQPNDVNVVFEAGGAKRWSSTYSSLIQTGNLNRFHLSGRNYVIDERIDLDSMGESETLQDFIEWGMEEYPAEKTALVFWNHGGGMRGVCYDENFEDDSLRNSEVKSALEGAGLNSNNKLEWIGYDACLMAVQDIAEFNSGYANYMVCSEESEAGYGWDYDTWLDDVFAKHDTETILTAIVDGFISDTNSLYRQYNWGDSDQTLSWLDLSQMSAYKTAFDAFATALSNKLNSSKVKANTFKSWVLNNVKYYGEEDVDYFCTFDAYDFVTQIRGSQYDPGGTYCYDVQQAFNNLVGHNAKGSGAGNSYGLALVYGNSSAYRLGTYYYGTDETNFSSWRSFNTNYGFI